jgi:hypothetical protein
VSPCRLPQISASTDFILVTPSWIVSLTSTTDNAAAQWIAKGDEAMENVVVTWGGFQVGRIFCESGHKKHTVRPPLPAFPLFLITNEE